MRWLQNLFQIREKADGDAIKPFLEHMEDLRWTIIRMAIVQVATMALAFCFRADLIRLLKAPLLGMKPVPVLMTTGIADSVVISLELAFFAGLALAFPSHVYAVTRFVLPALTRKERDYLLPGIVAGFALFLGGIWMAYTFLLPSTLAFFLKDALDAGLNPQWTYRTYFSFAAWLCFGFGALCEVPVVVVALGKLGLVSFRLLQRTRPYAYTLILILAAIVAPTPDPVMFLTMALPVLLIYEACIWVIWFLDRQALRSGKSRESGPDAASLLSLALLVHRCGHQERR